MRGLEGEHGLDGATQRHRRVLVVSGSADPEVLAYPTLTVVDLVDPPGTAGCGSVLELDSRRQDSSTWTMTRFIFAPFVEGSETDPSPRTTQPRSTGGGALGRARTLSVLDRVGGTSTFRPL